MIRLITAGGVYYSRQVLGMGVRKGCLKSSPFPATFCPRSKLPSLELRPSSVGSKKFDRQTYPSASKTQGFVLGGLFNPCTRSLTTIVSQHHPQAALDTAIILCRLNEVKLALRNGADPNTPLSLRDFYPIEKAVREGDVEIVRTLIAAGADPDMCDKELCNTSLHYAAFLGNARMVSALIQGKASVHIRNRSFGRIPLEEAIAQGKTECCNLLIQAGSDVKSKNPLTGFTPLRLACERGNPDIVVLLLEAGARPGVDGRAILEEAIATPQILQHILNCLSLCERVKLLEVRSKEGNTLLHVAAAIGSNLSVKILLEAGADLRAINNRVQFPVEIAEQRVVTLKIADLKPELITKIKKEYGELIKLLSLPWQGKDVSQQREAAGRFC